MELAFISLALLLQASTGISELFWVLRRRNKSLVLDKTYAEMVVPFGEQRTGITNFQS